MYAMIKGLFDEPVYAGSGRYLVQEVGCVHDALDYIEASSFHENDLIAKVTWQALSRCLEGQLPVSAARETFYRMLKKKGLLIEPERRQTTGGIQRGMSPCQSWGPGSGDPQQAQTAPSNVRETQYKIAQQDFWHRVVNSD
jgi:hypothetical protein